jgi:hypothetical protein
MDTVVIDGVEFVRKDSIKEKSEVVVDGLKFVICRTYSAGVFAGYLKTQNGQQVELVNARRLWYWKGANDLCDLSVNGVDSPSECKFSEIVSSVTLMQAIEILPVTKTAKKIIDGVKVWKK